MGAGQINKRQLCELCRIIHDVTGEAAICDDPYKEMYLYSHGQVSVGAALIG